MHQGQLSTSPYRLEDYPSPWKAVALRLFITAYAKAEELQCSPWLQAVRMRALRSAGIPHGVLQQLVDEGQLEFALETTQGAGRRRSFRRMRELSFHDKVCFVLTTVGVRTARQVCFPWEGPDGKGSTDLRLVEELPSRVDVPRWDRELHELRVGDWVVKRFRRPAPDQEAILDALEEEGWPDHLDDPLSPRPEQDTKQRLHDTVKRLNRGQSPKLIWFMGDGQGTGIRWRWV